MAHKELKFNEDARRSLERGVNILAIQSFPIGGKSVTRFVVDNPTTAKTVLDAERLTYLMSLT